MLKREFIEVIKQSFFFILAVVLLPLPILLTGVIEDHSYLDLLFYVFQAGMIFWPLFMGVSLFSSERRQGGMEYVLSLPFSRLQLVVVKALPRFCGIVFIGLLFLIFYLFRGEAYPKALLIYAPVAYFALFFIALSLSASSENFLVLSITSLVSLHIFLVVLFLIYRLALFIKGLNFYEFGEALKSKTAAFLPFASLFLLLPFLISFFLSFKKFDIRPAGIYNRRYVKYFVPLFLLGLIISFLFPYFGIKGEFPWYYLTQDLRLIEICYPLKIRIYEGERVFEAETEFGYFFPHLDESEYAYDLYEGRAARLNTATHTGEVLYEVPSEKSVSWLGWRYNQTIALFERNDDKSRVQLVLIDESSRKITKIPFEYPFQVKYYSPVIFGTDTVDGIRFWLISSWRAQDKPLLRLWEDGKVEIIGESQKRPCYVNKMIITYSDHEVIISKETEGRFEVIQKLPNSKGFHFGIELIRHKLNNISARELIGWKEGLEYAVLDLDSFEIREISGPKGYFHCFYPDGCYFVETERLAAALNVHGLKEGKPRLLKSFKNFDETKEENRFFICRGGIVLRRGRKVEVFAFPNLNELKFKGL